MNELDIGFLLATAKRRLPLVLLITTLAVGIAVAVAMWLPRSYVASAKILVESPQIPAELARSTVPISPVEQLQIVQQQITARDGLLALARRLNIYADSHGEPGSEDIVRDMTSRIRFEQMPGTQAATVYIISFSADKAALAAEVANELAQMVLDNNQRQRKGRAGSTLQFFNQEVTALDKQLRQIEDEILEFKNANKDTLPDTLEFRRTLLGNLQERLVALEREEGELRSRKNTLILAGNLQFPGAAPLTPQQQMLADLNRALAEQLSVFREDSPTIQALRSRILALQRSMLAERSNSSEEEETPGSKQAMFGLDLQLSDIADRMKAIANEEAAVGERINALSRSITGTPATETALNALLRNRDNIQTQYNAAIARRAEASTGEQIEMRSDGGRFTLLENAIPPTKAEKPKRRVVVALGGLGGLGLGVALAVLLEMLNKTVRRPQDLARLLQAQPLGTIPVLKTTRQIRAERIRRRMAALLTAGMIPACLIATHYFYMPLDLAFAKMLSGLGWTGVIGT